MKKLVLILLIFQANLVLSQPLKGVWHGKVYDSYGEAIKYINISINGEGKNLVASLRNYNKKDKIWVVDDDGVIEFISTQKSGILSKIFEKNNYTETNVFLLSYLNSKRIAIEWVSQVNDADSSKNVLSRRGTGFLEPFLDGEIYESLAIGGTSTNRVSIDKVEIAKEVTVITFSYHNTSFEQVMMRLARPGESGAYYITPSNRSNKYFIVDKDNIAYGPDNTIVAPNSYHTFKIYFESIPDSLRSFSILEGDPKMQTGQEWNFYDIQLK